MGPVIVQLFDFLVRAVVFFVTNSPNAAKEWEDVTSALMGQEAPQPEQEARYAESLAQARAARKAG